MLLSELIKMQAQEMDAELRAIRHHLHANPELSFQEFNTSAFIKRTLEDWEIPYISLADTGVVGILRGKNPESRIIALRADMDALPIQEENDIECKSKFDGIMHACGHDVHVTCLLGASKILQNLRDDWEGTVKLIFQPGEEKNPGGASILIKEGVLENPVPSAIVALHVNPALEVGKFSFRMGQAMASADEIYININARGGHAAAPHLTADTILIASHIVVALQQVISRNNNPLSPSVLSICSVQGGNATNVIPSQVQLMGTFRAVNEHWRFEAHEKIRQVVNGIAHAMGAEAVVKIDIGYPSVFNDFELTQKAIGLAEDFVGIENIEETELRMGAEDFGFYTRIVPGCFFRLGVRNEQKGIVHNVHTPIFDVDEDALKNGAGIMAWLATRL
jgi:hippurate hydrolase